MQVMSSVVIHVPGLEPKPHTLPKDRTKWILWTIPGISGGLEPEDAELGYMVIVTCKQNGLSSRTPEGEICKQSSNCPSVLTVG